MTPPDARRGPAGAPASIDTATKQFDAGKRSGPVRSGADVIEFSTARVADLERRVVELERKLAMTRRAVQYWRSMYLELRTETGAEQKQAPTQDPPQHPLHRTSQL
jgi:hypothetical protein